MKLNETLLAWNIHFQTLFNADQTNVECKLLFFD